MRDRGAHAVAAVCLLAFLALSFGDVLTTSPTNDEMTHLAAGWSYLKTGDFRMNPEHPPLVKSLAATPMLLLDIWPKRLQDDGSPASVAVMDEWARALEVNWAQWFFAHRLFYAVRDRHIGMIPTTEHIPWRDFLNNTERIFLLARGTLLVVIGIGLAITIFLWSSELWGAWGGALAVALLCFDPNFIAHTPLVTSDAAMALLMTLALFAFWRCCRTSSRASAVVFIAAMSLAHVAKFSAVLLWPMVIVVMFLAGRDRMARVLGLIAISIAATWVVIWASYGFDYEATSKPRPVEQTVNEWHEKKMQREERTEMTISLLGHGVLFANRHHLLPEAYLYGFALVQDGTVFRGAYLRGDFNSIGFPSYFFWTFLFKTPIPAILAILAAIVVAVRRRFLVAAVLLVPVIIYIAVSVNTGLNIGHRHILPIYPFLYVLCGALSRRWLIAPALVFVSGLTALGNHISYFNELARRPHELLIDSNLDWGQDLERLGRWVKDNNVNEPINLVFFGSAEPRYYGIRYLNFPGGLVQVAEVPLSDAKVPGLFAISIHRTVLGPQGLGSYDDFLRRHKAQLVARAGRTILIYRLGGQVFGFPVSLQNVEQRTATLKVIAEDVVRR